MGHTYSNLLVHAVFSTKGRQPMIQEALRQRLHKEMYGYKRLTFQEEFLELLRRHGIKYDPRYVWD